MMLVRAALVEFLKENQVPLIPSSGLGATWRLSPSQPITPPKHQTSPVCVNSDGESQGKGAISEGIPASVSLLKNTDTFLRTSASNGSKQTRYSTVDFFLPENIIRSHLNETGVRPHQNIKTPETWDPSAWVTWKNKPQVSHATCKFGYHTVVSVQHITNGNDNNSNPQAKPNQELITIPFSWGPWIRE